MTTYLGGTSQDEWAVFNGGNVINNGSSVHNESLGDFSVGNVIMCALDLDNQKVYFGKNGTWYNSANPSNGIYSFTLSGSEYYAAGWVYNTSDQLTFRFREGDFSYTVPTGFSAYSETNYDGTASNITYQEATKFQPDLVWIQNRSSSGGYFNAVMDSIRGATAIISTNSTGVETTSYTQELTSFDSNGFTLGTGGGNYVNRSGDDYVAWCFNAGSGSAASNTDGNITSTVKANTDAGFSIVSWQGAGTGGNYIGHGLGVKPQLIIIKNRDNARNFRTYVEALGATKFINLDTTEAAATYGSFGDTEPTTDVFYTSTVSAADRATNYAGEDFIAYCFHDVTGYQKIGTYTGTGAADNRVETGFQPAFILFKRTDSADRWLIADNKRADALTNMDDFLDAQDTAQEGSFGATNGIDFLSDGFSINTTDGVLNASSGTYIYLAIAADPDTTTPTVENSFDVVTYTGTGSSQDIETDFKPDLVWVKIRTQAYAHNWMDSIRGVNKQIRSSGTNAEITNDTLITSFNDNGFTVGTGSDSNKSGDDFVAWCWKAGDHDDNLPEINTEGTIDSTVSVNDAAGFSIVKFTTNLSSGQSTTVGHGLSNPPEIIIQKNLSNPYNWWVSIDGISGFSQDDYLSLNQNIDKENISQPFGRATSDVFSVSEAFMGSGTQNSIAYCWYSVTGHSSIGSYTGEGSSGKTITTGFRPRWVMIKRTDADNDWVIIDSERDTTDPYAQILWADLADNEASGGSTTALSFSNTGFSMSTSANGG